MKITLLVDVLKLSLLFNLAIVTLSSAQVIPDNNLPDNTVVNPQENKLKIEGGTTRGNNLFHSFQEFSVSENITASFNNSSNIQHIFSRVTGNSISHIEGILEAQGNANLFLINPNGIIFGKDASLNIGGSFLATTADSIRFADGTEFQNKKTSNNNSLLTISAPIGLGFLDNSGDIVNRSQINNTGLQVLPGKTISLVGGQVKLEGGAITARGGLVELGGLLEPGKINISENNNLNFPQNIVKGDVALSGGAIVNVAADGGGFINIQARNFILSEKSQLIAGIAENQGSPATKAGDITISATESVKIFGNNDEVGLDTEIHNHVGLTPEKRNNPDQGSNAQGNGGAINIDTNFLEINNEGKITAINFSEGNSGEVFINANNILIQKGAITSEVNRGKGNSGNITINAEDSIILNDGVEDAANGILSQVTSNGDGDVGDIRINTGTLRLKDKSVILADNQGKGNAGNITINAKDSVILDGSNQISLDGSSLIPLILSQVQNDVIGNGGDINVAAPIISLANFSLISTNAKKGSIGKAGNITLNANQIGITYGSIIDALTENNFDGGNININADRLNLSDGGKIVTSGDSGGNAGSINLNVTDIISINNENPPADSPFFEQILQDTALEAGLLANTVEGAKGDAGNINIQSNSIELIKNGSISATTASGIGGNINLQIDDTLSLQENNLISTEAGEVGNGGNINIDTQFIITNPNGNNDIVANAGTGIGGKINISAESLFGIQERTLNEFTNDINASSEFGLDGTININLPDVDRKSGLVELPDVPIDAAAIFAQDLCKFENEKIAKGSSFIVTGKGGLTPTAEDGLGNLDRVVSWANREDLELSNNGTVGIRQRKEQTANDPLIRQSQGWVRASDGSIWLVANATETTLQNAGINHPSCGDYTNYQK